MFSTEEYNQCDNRAKQKFTELFESSEKYNDFYLVSPSDPFTVDFYIYKKATNNHVANIEVEVKRVWTTYNFFYKDIQILPRKQKFWLEEYHHKNKPTMLVMFNENLDNHFAVKSEVMSKLFTSTENTRSYNSYKSRGDSFFVLDINLVKFGEFTNII
jgi:hypothetical protein